MHLSGRFETFDFGFEAIEIFLLIPIQISLFSRL
jgi:hypothetical protein